MPDFGKKRRENARKKEEKRQDRVDPVIETIMNSAEAKDSDENCTISLSTALIAVNFIGRLETYDMGSLLKWLKENPRDPVTKVSVPIDELVRHVTINRGLIKKLNDKFKEHDIEQEDVLKRYDLTPALYNYLVNMEFCVKKNFFQKYHITTTLFWLTLLGLTYLAFYDALSSNFCGRPENKHTLIPLALMPFIVLVGTAHEINRTWVFPHAQPELVFLLSLVAVFIEWDMVKNRFGFFDAWLRAEPANRYSHPVCETSPWKMHLAGTSMLVTPISFFGKVMMGSCKRWRWPGRQTGVAAEFEALGRERNYDYLSTPAKKL
ncbi:MAG TPA: hypothetical protein VLI69_02500 [Gammaproteobacteria bacterium]|nr:hypothetical protein [Gammaproteobacteria bacterium]